MSRSALLLVASCLLNLERIHAQEQPQQPQLAAPTQFTTAPQCRCSEIATCSEGMEGKTTSCKTDSTCEAFLKKIGDPVKIRACLDTEHNHITELEDCVKAKVNGELGCTNDEQPKNLTIPLIPLIEAPIPSDNETTSSSTPEGAAAVPPGQGPPELAHYLMCVDQCSLEGIDFATFTTTPARRKRSPVNCAFKLRCALAPPTEQVQKAFSECERELKIIPAERFMESCRCLQAAGVTMECVVPTAPAQ